jgi:His-Xaa-Ser system radical SAM maturase HxsC
MHLSAHIPKIQNGSEPFIARVSEFSPGSQSQQGLLIRTDKSTHELPIPKELDYLRAGDIVRVNEPAGEIRVLYRRNSLHNVLFFTERCNSRCLMCSQPPRTVDDGYLVEEILEAIPLMSPDTEALCMTGGEPTLLGPKLLDVIRAAKQHLPRTALHMLTNGRLFASTTLAQSVAEIDHPDFMMGIPLYSDIASKHDFVVQAKGAFDQTVRGIMKLKQANQRIEIRFVIHKQTVERLPQTARFIARNIPFVDQVALMGLEMTGFTRPNLEALWVDPFDYQPQLREAVREMNCSQIKVMIYNHQLCVLDKEFWQFARRSISDWKNIYMPECGECAIREDCGGFFASAALRYSRHIKPFGTIIPALYVDTELSTAPHFSPVAPKAG